MQGPTPGVPTFNFSRYQPITTDPNAEADRLMQETATARSNDPRLNRRQKTQIREALGSAGAVSPQHPLHLLYNALKIELEPESRFREESLNDFANRFIAEASNDVASKTFLQSIQDNSSELYLHGLAKSVEENSEKSDQRQFAITVYVSEHYPIPL